MGLRAVGVFQFDDLACGVGGPFPALLVGRGVAVYLVRPLDRAFVEERAGGHEQYFRFQTVGGPAGETSVVVVRVFRGQQRRGLVAQADDVFHTVAEL